ncbi:PilT/PilU family type 4a pilus ATPase [Thiocystis violacea]|uniref:PilT/PilU family type 4a pilus ATPase n=1 Tax=Thiocystis violacea TaxID=13725 RepID=UPI001904AB3A|nr:PilT/PilU family type 4a pilus ATPase [Thiocystis violacea]MBK1716143.1 type IV pili twitching motility protein PilT [Thiocystis violacea]
MDLRRALEQLLGALVEKKGSDLFITSGWPPSIKIDGTIYPAAKQPLSADQAQGMAYEIMNERQRAEFEDTKECQFALDRAPLGRFRVSAFVQREACGMVLRRIETRIPTMEELKLPSVLRDLAMTKRGLVIFVGATGTGKSTSLAALVGYRNHHSSGHIITIEDPIEYVHEHDGCIITQREVGVDTESFEVALRNTLRQAPDVILIGEVRTRQTMEYAMTFAETGHLVLATLHANNANQAMDRIINFFPEESRHQMLMDLSLNLKGIVAQQLAPRKNGQGRRAVIEVLLNTPLAADLIRMGEVHKLKELMKRSGEQGMITFDQALFNLYQEGEISYEDALRHADSANEVRLMIKLQSGSAQRAATERSIDGITLVEDQEPNGARW